MDSPVRLATCIDEAVTPHGFKRFDPIAAKNSLDWVAAWKRKTLNTNRGIALLAMPNEVAHAGEYALHVRKAAAKPIGYIPFLYELGLQLVLCGSEILKKAEDLERFVTKINNSTVLLQSIHVVDTASGESRSARTWGQVITGKFIDAIMSGISRFGADRKAGPSKEIEAPH